MSFSDAGDGLTEYELTLPVYKQGDDFDSYREDGATAAESFRKLAEQYEAAAAICRQMAAVAFETPGLRAEGCTHFIAVTGPGDQLDRLAQGEGRMLDFAPDLDSDAFWDQGGGI